MNANIVTVFNVLKWLLMVITALTLAINIYIFINAAVRGHEAGEVIILGVIALVHFFSFWGFFTEDLCSGLVFGIYIYKICKHWNSTRSNS